MRIIIDIAEKNITRWGSIIILNPLHGPKEAGIALPGFEFNVPKDEAVFFFNWEPDKKIDEIIIKPEEIEKLKIINKGE